MENLKNHILPLSTYLIIGSILLGLTIITVIVAQFDFGRWNIFIALAIASCKAILVALYFMHLKYDNKIYMVIFVSSIAFLAIFITFTMMDTLYRGEINEIRNKPVNQYAIIYDQMGKPIPMEDRAGLFDKPEEVIQEKVPFEYKHGYGPIKEEIKVGPLDTVMALEGKEMFKMKCGTCHKLDERYTGPPLRGVTVYRTPTFIMNQILDPQQNVTKHPDMQALLGQYYTMMTFQNVTQEDARKIVEYLRYEATRSPNQ